MSYVKAPNVSNEVNGINNLDCTIRSQALWLFSVYNSQIPMPELNIGIKVSFTLHSLFKSERYIISDSMSPGNAQ